VGAPSPNISQERRSYVNYNC